MATNNAMVSTTDGSVRSMLISLEQSGGVRLSPLERLLLSTDGTVTHMLEVLTRREVSVRILDREVSGEQLHRTVALECESESVPLIWAQSKIQLSPLADALARELVDGDIGIGHVLDEECTETRRTITEMAVRFDDVTYPSFVEGNPASDPACLLERTYQIYTADTLIMTITEFVPKGRLSRYRIR